MKEGRATLTPHALAPTLQRLWCRSARQRRLLCVATATPQSRRSSAQRRRRCALPLLRRLKVFSQATATPPLRWHGVGSRLSLNMKPGADGHPGGSWPWRPAVASTGDPPQRCSVLLQTGPRRLARGPLALAPRTSRRTTALLHASHRSICCARVSGLHRQRQGEGASSIQSQRICLMLPWHVTAFRQGGVPWAPEVMLDDAVRAHPGRLRLRRTRCIACSRRLLLRKEWESFSFVIAWRLRVCPERSRSDLVNPTSGPITQTGKSGPERWRSDLVIPTSDVYRDNHNDKGDFLSWPYLGSTPVTLILSGEDTPSSWKAVRTPKDLLWRSGICILG